MSTISIKTKLEEAGLNSVDLFEKGISDVFMQAVGGIAQGARAEWIRLAESRLKSSRFDYINGLQQANSFQASVVRDSALYTIELVGRMPNNFEFGMPSFDMKTVRPGWLGGSKAKTSKDGKKYITIPFRHSKTSTTNFSYSGQAKRANLKEELKKSVKQYGLDRMIRTATGKVVEGAVKKIPTKARDVHPFLRGLTRIQSGKSGGSRGKQHGESQLITWRVMSEASDPSSWIHPGIKGANLLPEVERWIDQQLDMVIDNMFRGV